MTIKRRLVPETEIKFETLKKYHIGRRCYEMILLCQVDIYGGQFPQLEEQIVPVSEPATFR